MLGPLPPETLPTTPHITFGIFNFAIPNIVAWILVFVVVLVASWLRLPKIFEPEPEPGQDSE